MEQALVQLGVGGVFALLILREVLNFLKNRDKNTRADHQSDRLDSGGSVAAGGRSVEFWREEMADLMAQSIKDVTDPKFQNIDQRQERILSNQADGRNRMSDMTTRMVIALEAIQASLERIERGRGMSQ